MNLSEAVAKVLDRGADLETVLGQLRSAPFKVVPFDRPRAEAAGALRTATRRKNVSFADRACLALAIETRLPVLTTDRVWAELGLDVEIRLIR